MKSGHVCFTKLFQGKRWKIYYFFIAIVCICFSLFSAKNVSSLVLPRFSYSRPEHFGSGQSLDKPLVILHNTPYTAPESTIPKSYNDRIRNENWGDWLWKYAADTMIDESKDMICNLTMSKCIQKYKSLSKIVHYFPFANDMATEELYHPVRIQKMNLSSHIIKESRDTFFALGLGTQAEFSAEKAKQDLGLALDIEIKPEDVKLHSSSVNFLSEMESMKQVAFFRGSFTNKVAKLHGYHYGIETGCPTLMINHDVALGKSLQRKYDEISQRIGDRTIKLALNSNPMFPRIQRLCVKLMELYPNAILYTQIGNDIEQFRRSGIPFERVRIFQGDVKAWMEDIKDMDMAFGARIHGNMFAMAANPAIPVFVLAPDHRVLELAQTMKIPYTDLYDRRLLNEELDIAELVRDYQFDGLEFDQNRCAIAKHYVRELSAVGLKIASHIISISKNC